MSANEIYESFQPAESRQETHSSNLAEYVLEPTNTAQFMQDKQDANHGLVAQRILPDVDIFEMPSQTTAAIRGERPEGKLVPDIPAGDNDWIRGERPEGKIVLSPEARPDPGFSPPERPGTLPGDFPLPGGAFPGDPGFDPPPDLPGGGFPLPRGAFPRDQPAFDPPGEFPLPRGAFPGEDLPEGTQLALAESGKRVKETPRPDGTGKEIRYDNGAIRWVNDDGSTVEIRKNGLSIGEDRDHDVTVKLQDGSWLHRSPGDPAANVKEVVVDDDGTVWYHYKDGTMESIDPDNTRTYITELGRVTTYPDGTQHFDNIDGSWAWHDPSTGEWKGGDKNGTVRWVIDEHGKRTDYDKHGKKVHEKRKHR